ncbi:protein GVQW3 [Trichonephila clavipes]|nr:protein GVQW3 [Trichonephila clavipes]
MDQRINMLFCFKLGKSAKETHEMLKKVYKDEAITSKSVYEWLKRFREGRTSLEDAPRAGRPKATHTQENIERIMQLGENDRHLTKRMTAEELGIGTESVHLIIIEDLGKRISAADSYSIV